MIGSYAIVCFEMMTHGIVAFPVLIAPIVHDNERGDIMIPLEEMDIMGRKKENDSDKNLYRDGIKAMSLYLELVEREKTLVKNAEYVAGLQKRKVAIQRDFETIQKEKDPEKRRAMMRAEIEKNKS